jgi:hypothetical protein
LVYHHYVSGTGLRHFIKDRGGGRVVSIGVVPHILLRTSFNEVTHIFIINNYTNMSNFIQTIKIVIKKLIIYYENRII